MAPGSRAALSLLAHCYYRQEEFEAAAQAYEALAARCPAVPEYRLYWAQSLAKAGQWGEAARVAASVEGFQKVSGLMWGSRNGQAWRRGAGGICAHACRNRSVEYPALAAATPLPAPQEVRLLQCAIKYEAGDLRGCRAALEALPAGGSAAATTAGCLAYKEGRWAEAASRFSEAMQMVRDTVVCFGSIMRRLMPASQAD